MKEYKILQNSEDIEMNMLQNRNLTKEEVNNLLVPTKKMVENISNYKNLDIGIGMYLNAIEERKQIATLVDVDADGYLSSAIAYNFTIDEMNYDNIVFILKDTKEHGLTDEIVDKLYTSNVKLLIIPDAGSENYELLKKVSDFGIDILVLDHHIIEITQEQQEALHNVVIVNNQDGQVENKYLSGTGVTYKFFNQVANRKGIKLKNKYIDCVAVSLITDVCNLKLSYENRYFLNEGSKPSKITNPFIKFFVKKLKKGKSKFTITEIGFDIGPKINSIIRYGSIEEKEILFNSLIGCDELIDGITYQEMAYKVGGKYQRSQRNAVKQIVPVIQEEIENNKLGNNSVIFVDSTDIIKSNIRGLVCNKLIDIYKRPVMVLTLEDGYYSGSARGYGQLDFKDFCEKTNLFEYCKGHSKAFGVSIKKENVPLFLDYCNKVLEVNDNEEVIIEKVYNEEIPLEDLLVVSEYEELWCNQIKAPVYLLTDVYLDSNSIKRTGNSTYVIKIGDITYVKEFCSLARYNDILQAIEQEGKLKVDILVQFRKGKKAYAKVLDIIY